MLIVILQVQVQTIEFTKVSRNIYGRNAIGYATHLGKFTQSCKPLVFSQPGISEWTIPGKIELKNKQKWLMSQQNTSSCSHPLEVSCLKWFGNVIQIAWSVFTIMFQVESLYMNSYMADIFNQMVYLQDPMMSKKVLVGELSLQ